MHRFVLSICLVFSVTLHARMPDGERGRGLQVLLSEVQPGTMATEQYCMLIFADHTFHAEKANRKLGRDRERKAYEGQLQDAEWKALINILDTEQFRNLHVAAESTRLVVPDAHTYNISVARDKEFQNLEFLDDSSRKSYDAQLKPLFQWWKSVRSRHMAASTAPSDSRCALDNSHAVFAY